MTEYAPGAAIGWHKDKAVFGKVVGISLLSSCVFRMRRRTGRTWERASFTAERRSAYLLQGPARSEWGHSIPAVDSLRYSITFRNVRRGTARVDNQVDPGREGSSRISPLRSASVHRNGPARGTNDPHPR